MPRVHTQKARKDIYRLGAKIEDSKTKRGYRIDRSKPRDKDDIVIIPKGSTYYKWTFRFGGTHRSLTRPKASQLTQSDFLQRVYAWNETDVITYNDDICIDDVESARDERVQEIDELKDETQDKLYNMPESLQYAPTGEMLQGRIDSLEEMMSELELINIDDENLEDSIDEINNVEYYGE